MIWWKVWIRSRHASCLVPFRLSFSFILPATDVIILCYHLCHYLMSSSVSSSYVINLLHPRCHHLMSSSVSSSQSLSSTSSFFIIGGLSLFIIGVILTIIVIFIGVLFGVLYRIFLHHITSILLLRGWASECNTSRGLHPLLLSGDDITAHSTPGARQALPARWLRRNQLLRR